MSRKVKAHESKKASIVRRAPESASQARRESVRPATPDQTFAQALTAPSQALAPADILALQQSIGNRAAQQLLGAMLGQADSLTSSQISQPHALPVQSSTAASAIQRKTEEELLRGKSETSRKKENTTGLPDQLKAGIENLSGVSLDDVKVHYNSSKPAEVQALAYTQGTDIHLREDEEEHLPHEAWHVVQQKKGRVKPTMQAKGVAINDDRALEREADVMGTKALQMKSASSSAIRFGNRGTAIQQPVTRLSILRTIQRVEDSKEKRRELWGTKERSKIGKWKKDTMKAYWDLVKAKLEPTYSKVATAQAALRDIHSYMIHADHTPARAQLDALYNSAPAIEGSPVIRNDTDNNLLTTLKAKLDWVNVLRNRKVHWDKAINDELKTKKDNLTATDEWQIYGEALLAEQRGENKNTRWNSGATTAAKAITTKSDETNTALNKWLNAILARTKTLKNLWTAATAPVNGTYGNIPRKTVEQLFIRYEPNMTRPILTNAVAANISGTEWGGVKYLAGNRRYARELKIHAMGGDHRVFSRTATPTVLDTIGRGLH